MQRSFNEQMMQLAAMRYFNPRVNICVPNVSWGMDLHECDMLVLSPAGYATEVEIKVSRADILAEKRKAHGHYNKRIARLFFLVPAELRDFALAKIPDRAGLLVVESVGHLWPTVARDAKRCGTYCWSDRERLNLMRLGCMRLQSYLDALNRRGDDVDLDMVG